jgi:hypothetical protein
MHLLQTHKQRNEKGESLFVTKVNIRRDVDIQYLLTPLYKKEKKMLLQYDNVTFVRFVQDLFTLLLKNLNIKRKTNFFFI